MYNLDRCKDISLRNHQQYIGIIDKLRKKTDKIILVQTLGRKKSDEILIKAMSCMELIDEKSTNEWLGTLTKGKSAIEYTFKATPEFFDYLKKFEAFFIVETDKYGGYNVTYTDFNSNDDIAFIDKNDYVLFYTTTHEGYAYMVSEI